MSLAMPVVKWPGVFFDITFGKLRRSAMFVVLKPRGITSPVRGGMFWFVPNYVLLTELGFFWVWRFFGRLISVNIG